ncbi:hypothetical protein ACFJGW_22020 [Burkholderiaceae bacterium UC74_6]
METTIDIKSFAFQPSENGEWHKIVFDDRRGQQVSGILRTAELREVAEALMDYVAKLEAKAAPASAA